MCTHPTKPLLARPLSRRTLLRGLSLAASGALLAACGPPRGESAAMARQLAFGPQVTPQTILPSPMPDTTVTPTADQDSLSLDEFLLLSTVLTGVPNLDPELGQLYLQNLNATHGAATLADLYTETGLRTTAPAANATAPPANATLAAATASLDKSTGGPLAATIAKLWYSGIYTADSGEAIVATFADALAWKTLTFTKPTTICGEPGFWSEAWEATLD